MQSKIVHNLIAQEEKIIRRIHLYFDKQIELSVSRYSLDLLDSID